MSGAFSEKPLSSDQPAGADGPVRSDSHQSNHAPDAVSEPRKTNHGSRRHIAYLIDKIKETADELADDRTSRGDLKILSRALRELRWAFKVFSPYRRDRKVTVFGSPGPDPTSRLTVRRLILVERWPSRVGWS